MARLGASETMVDHMTVSVLNAQATSTVAILRLTVPDGGNVIVELLIELRNGARRKREKGRVFLSWG